MREGMLPIRDVEGPKKTESVEARLGAMEEQVFKCQGMVERGLNANHMMITEFTNKHKIDANDIGKHLSRLYNRFDHLQAQIYDLQNQNCDFPPRFFRQSGAWGFHLDVGMVVIELVRQHPAWGFHLGVGMVPIQLVRQHGAWGIHLCMGVVAVQPFR
ncbi:40S ribosomal protein S5-1 [Hordeum vulgare]|nr:40S ribosomal protein S5-1 [Hordeum vulgare]